MLCCEPLEGKESLLFNFASKSTAHDLFILMLKEVQSRDDALLVGHLGVFCNNLPRQVKSALGNKFHVEFSQVTSSLKPSGQRE